MHGRDERIRVRDFYGGLEFYNRFVRALAVPEPFPSGLRGTHCFESGTFSDAVHLMKFFTSSTRPRFPENPPPPRHWGASLGQGCDGIMCFCAFGKYVGPKYERPIPFRGRYSFRWDTSKDASRCSTRTGAAGNCRSFDQLESGLSARLLVVRQRCGSADCLRRNYEVSGTKLARAM